MAKKKKEMDNLAKDAASALAAGMSYGRWKAMQDQPVVIKREEPSPQGWLICKHCGKPFKPRSKRAQYYCEANCQAEAQRERNKEKIREHYRVYMAKRRAEQRGANNGQEV